MRGNLQRSLLLQLCRNETYIFRRPKQITYDNAINPIKLDSIPYISYGHRHVTN